MSRPRITILDGGMGTTLEALGHDVSGPMWGSELLSSNPDAIRAVHAGFADAGADLIETATYQMTIPALLATHSKQGAEGLMARAIDLAHSSVSTAADNVHSTTSQAGVVLSLGPFGASLSPSQEYAGIYPPPYGPVSAPSSSPAESESESGTAPSLGPSNAFTDPQAELEAEYHLALFHLARLRAFARANDGAAWRQVRWLAFETVPLLVEIRAIRRAVGALFAHPSGSEVDTGTGTGTGLCPAVAEKAFWISSPFPNGQHPQHLAPDAAAHAHEHVHEHEHEHQHVTPESFLAACIAPLAPLALLPVRHPLCSEPLSDLIASSPAPPADGVGINCTAPAHLPSLLPRLTAALAATPSAKSQTQTRTQSQSQNQTPRHRPYLVLYPDGGATYDTTTKTWTARAAGAQEWARDVATLAWEAAGAMTGIEASGAGTEQPGPDDAYVWEGVIVGGCCKASFDEIRLLRKELDAIDETPAQT